MSVVCAPLDTRLLLYSLIQPHAIKQESLCSQGQSQSSSQPLLSSPVLSLISSQAVYRAHGAEQTHTLRWPPGLRCLEVNRIIWSCSVIALRQLKLHNRRVFFFFVILSSSFMHPSIRLPLSLSRCRASCSEPGSIHLFQPSSAPWNLNLASKTGRADRRVRGQWTEEKELLWTGVKNRSQAGHTEAAIYLCASLLLPLVSKHTRPCALPLPTKQFSWFSAKTMGHSAPPLHSHSH